MIATLGAKIDVAVAAARRRRGRDVEEVASALAAAAARWRDDPALAAALPAMARLDRTMVAHVLPLVAEAIDVEALVALHTREAEPDGPALVAHALASNVPGLAVPAIALGCLAGAAVVVKSGRADTLSAPAFRRALEAVDPDLAATVVTTYWPGGAADLEEAVLGRADVVVATGGDASTGALAARLPARVVAYADRSSLAVMPDRASDDAVRDLAWDVARYERRGCLSPGVVLALGDARRLAERLRAALETIARAVPPPPPTTAERAAARLAIEEARFVGAEVLDGAGGPVMVDDAGRLGDGPAGRSVRVVPITSAADVLDAVVPGRIECVGVGGELRLDADALRRRGVARLCPVGRMQRPRIDWPRGQHPALGVLFRAASGPRIQVET